MYRKTITGIRLKLACHGLLADNICGEILLFEGEGENIFLAG